MIIRATRSGSGSSLEQLRRQCATTSVWTIDIAHMLRRFGIRVTMFTRVPGVNPAYIHERYYEGVIMVDAERVTRLFGEASRSGIDVISRTLNTSELADAVLRDGTAAVVLVDRTVLRQDTGADGYVGHYILVVAWDGTAQQFVVVDPDAPAPGVFRISPSALDAARSAFGTDDDVLVVR